MGQDEIDLGEWDFVAVQGLTLIGKRDGDVLSPVCQVHCNVVQDQHGRAGTMLVISTFLGRDLPRFHVPKEAVRFPLTAFRDRDFWLDKVRQAERVQETERLRSLNIVRSGGRS